MLKLIKDDVTYEISFKLENEPEDKWPVFIMRKLSSAKVNSINDQITRTEKGSTAMCFLGGKSSALKVDAALVNWRNVFDADGNPVPCTSENKGQLPAEIQSFLEENIDNENRLKGLGEKERKNS